jgi:Cd2+/Zn2+-exporting ATPase
MNLLMTVAVIGAALIGQWPEAAVVIWLFGIAEMIEALSLDRARNAIRKLMDLAPENALVRQPDGQWREVKADSVPSAALYGCVRANASHWMVKSSRANHR